MFMHRVTDGRYQGIGRLAASIVLDSVRDIGNNVG
jgi:hypothetical protein